MSGKIGCLAAVVMLTTAFGLHAGDGELVFPEDVNLAVDGVVELVMDTVPHGEEQHAVIAVRSIEMENRIPAFGELFSLAVSTRIALAEEPGLFVRSLLPVDSYLNEFSSLDAGNVREEDFKAKADFILIGESFQTSGTLHLLFQIIDVKSETIIGGLEDALILDQWLFDLLEIGAPDVVRGDVGPDSFEPDSVDAPLAISPDDIVTDRTIGPPGDRDWYVLEPVGFEGKMIIEIYTTGETDTYIEAYGPEDPTVLLEENDDNVDSNAMVRILAESGQTVWISVRGYDETVSGYYDLHIESAMFDGDPYEPDDAIEQANRLNLGGDPVSSYILPATDEDWYFIDITQVPGDNTILSIETFGALDTFLDLYDEDGIQILSNDDSGEDDNARVDMFLETPGRFYVKVTHYDGTDQGEYAIAADFASAAPDQYESDDSRNEAKPITFGESQQKNFTPSDDQDWVTFELDETSTVMIGTTGDADTYLKLFDRIGNMVAEDDDSGNDYNAFIERLLQRGQYFVRVHQVEIDSSFGAEYRIQIEKR